MDAPRALIDAGGEYPVDFLVARLKGRRAFMPRDWDGLQQAANPMDFLKDSLPYVYVVEHGREGLWKFLHSEHCWVFARMHRRLRKRFMPYFLYFELQTIIACLRHRLHNRLPEPGLSDTIARSLLDKKTQHLFLEEMGNDRLLAAIEAYLAAVSSEFAGIAAEFRRQGAVALEQAIMDRFFVYACQGSIHPVMRGFFSRLIDMRNLLSLRKALRWQAAAPPSFLSGGTLALPQLKAAFDRKTMAAVAGHIGPGQDGRGPEPLILETTLLTGLTRYCRQCAQQLSNTGFILHYLWEQYRCVRNLGTILYCPPLGPGRPDAGLIQ